MTPRAIVELSEILGLEIDDALMSKAKIWVATWSNHANHAYLSNPQYFELRLAYLEWLFPCFRHLRIITGGLLHEDKLLSELNTLRRMKRLEERWKGLSYYKKSTRG